MTSEEKITRIGEALGKARYSNIAQAGRVHALTAALLGCAQRKGQTMPEHAAETTAASLDAEVDRYFGREMSFDEVMLALDWGMHREFGEYSGINVDRMFDFVRLYRACPERAEAERRWKSLAALPERAEPRADVGRRNWESAMRCTRRYWEEFRGERKDEAPDGPLADSLRGALEVSRRVLMANCYRWLKSEGVVAADEAAMAFENRERRRMAERYGDREKPGVVENRAMQACLLATFRACADQGFDIGAALDDLERNIPPEERRYYTR